MGIQWILGGRLLAYDLGVWDRIYFSRIRAIPIVSCDLPVLMISRMGKVNSVWYSFCFAVLNLIVEVPLHLETSTKIYPHHWRHEVSNVDFTDKGRCHLPLHHRRTCFEDRLMLMYLLQKSNILTKLSTEYLCSNHVWQFDGLSSLRNRLSFSAVWSMKVFERSVLRQSTMVRYREPLTLNPVKILFFQEFARRWNFLWPYTKQYSLHSSLRFSKWNDKAAFS